MKAIIAAVAQTLPHRSTLLTRGKWRRFFIKRAIAKSQDCLFSEIRSTGEDSKYYDISEQQTSSGSALNYFNFSCVEE
jgi:hypothetical protein